MLKDQTTWGFTLQKSEAKCFKSELIWSYTDFTKKNGKSINDYLRRMIEKLDNRHVDEDILLHYLFLN